MDNDDPGHLSFMDKLVRAYLLVLLVGAAVFVAIMALAACWAGAYFTGLWDA